MQLYLKTEVPRNTCNTSKGCGITSKLSQRNVPDLLRGEIFMDVFWKYQLILNSILDSNRIWLRVLIIISSINVIEFIEGAKELIFLNIWNNSVILIY